MGLALAAVLAVAACSSSGGGGATPSGQESGGVATVGTAGDGVGATPPGQEPGGAATAGAGGGGGGTGDTGPWPVGLSSGGAVVGTPGKYCGGPDPTILGSIDVSVPHGPVTVTLVWHAQDDSFADPLAESTVQFTGTGGQTKTVNADWLGKWHSEVGVRVEVHEVVPGPGQDGTYLPPNPHEFSYAVGQCAKPDINVTIVGVQVAPQPCGNPAQVIPVAQVTLNSPISANTGPVAVKFRWERADGFTGPWVELQFHPGGPATLPASTVWLLPANASFTAEAIVRTRVTQIHGVTHTYGAQAKPFVTYCLPG